MRRKRSICRLRVARGVLAAAILAVAGEAGAVDIGGVQPAALDQPRINAYIRLTPNDTPLSFEGTFNVQAFYDTGASGILLSNNTAGMLGLTPTMFLNPKTGQMEEVVYGDVGVAGSDEFNVSQQVHFGLAPYHPNADLDNPDTYTSVYNQTFGPVRTQLGPINQANPNPLLEDLDVLGMPLMQGKVVVMDPKPVNTFLDTMRTYVYNPGTAYNPAESTSNPGIPSTSFHVKLSYADFSRFTELFPTVDPGQPTPPGPTMADNPFIGPNPVLALDPNAPPDNTPKVQLAYNGQSTAGSFLLDTGAAASMISEAMAANLGIRYAPGSVESGDPILEGVPLEDQFQITIGGIGGTTRKAGFFLDSLLLPTEEGAQDPSNHLNFTRAPVLVSNITVKDPFTNQPLTLDGIFGVNFLIASAFISESGSTGGDVMQFPIVDQLTFGRFDWVVFDQPNKRLGLSLLGGNLVQGSLLWVGRIDENFEWVGEWDVQTHDNWISAGALSTYKDGDYVLFADGLEMFGDAFAAPDIDVISPVTPGSVRFENNLIDYTVRGAAIQGKTSLIKRGSGSVRFENHNTYTGATAIYEGTVIFAAEQNIGDVGVFSAGRLIMETSQRLANLNVAGGAASLTPGGNKVLVTTGLLVSDGGSLDMANNVLIIHTAPETGDSTLIQIQNLIKAARGNAGDWQGDGLTSSTARENTTRLTGLGAILNDRGGLGPIYTRFAGEPVGQDAILVKYTWLGDANLDGVVNADDYFQIDSGYISQKKGWYNGDFNYDGVVNADDYFLIDSSFIGQRGPLSLTTRSGAVPEPAALLALGLGILALRRR